MVVSGEAGYQVDVPNLSRYGRYPDAHSVLDQINGAISTRVQGDIEEYDSQKYIAGYTHAVVVYAPEQDGGQEKFKVFKPLARDPKRYMDPAEIPEINMNHINKALYEVLKAQQGTRTMYVIRNDDVNEAQIRGLQELGIIK